MISNYTQNNSVNVTTDYDGIGFVVGCVSSNFSINNSVVTVSFSQFYDASSSDDFSGTVGCSTAQIIAILNVQVNFSFYLSSDQSFELLVGYFDADAHMTIVNVSANRRLPCFDDYGNTISYIVYSNCSCT